MADLVVRLDALRSLPVPDVCARTGRPATRRAKVTIVHTPWWAYLGLLGGWLVLLVLALVTQRKTVVHLPHARRRVVRRRVAFAAAAFLGMVLPFLVMAVYFEPGAVSVTVLAVGASAFAGSVSACRGALVRGKWVDLETVKLIGLHPSFHAVLAAGLAQHEASLRARAIAGWHPDPSGAYALRWFDGVQWTPHVAGIAGEAVRPRPAF